MSKPGEMDATKPVDDFNYYVGAVYWNNFDQVQRRTCQLISGSEAIDWMGHVRRVYGGCHTGLFLHCGNGWVERAFQSHNLIQHAIGTDISEQLISEAREDAAKCGLSSQYQRLDTNTADFSQFDFDWVINHAAFHHITYLDHAVRSLARSMKPNGLLVAFDYTGPQRNQYPWEIWSQVIRVWQSLPPEFRVDLRYPHLPTILATDPTEAVHADDILQVVGRYFDFVEQKPVGGAIAYELLYQNTRLHAAQHTPEGQATIAHILAEDWAFTQDDPKRSFFNYFVCRPKPPATWSDTDLCRWTEEEVAREAYAAAHAGRYGPVAPLEVIYNEIADLRDAVKHAQRPDAPVPAPPPQPARLRARLASWVRGVLT